jgi:hypothetical protein
MPMQVPKSSKRKKKTKAPAKRRSREQILLTEMEGVLSTVEHVIAESPHGLKPDDLLFTIHNVLSATVEGLELQAGGPTLRHDHHTHADTTPRARPPRCPTVGSTAAAARAQPPLTQLLTSSCVGNFRLKDGDLRGTEHIRPEDGRLLERAYGKGVMAAGRS